MENKLYDIADTLGSVIRDQASTSAGDGLSKRYGTVTQIKTDGSLMIAPDGSTTAISCGRACSPKVGDRVVILTEGSQWLAIGTIGGDGLPLAVQSAQTIDCTMANLQATINSLPKILMNNVTIRVSAGTIATAIEVSRFFGLGSLEIQAVDANKIINTTMNNQTHCATTFTVQYNCLPNIILRGFTATATTGNCFHVQVNSGWVGLYTCNATAGNNTATANVGVRSYIQNGLLYMANCTLSNKYQAVLCLLGQINIAGGNAGTGNNTVFRAEQSGVISIQSVGTLSGTTMHSATGNGQITGATTVTVIESSGINDETEWVWVKYSNGWFEARRTSSTNLTYNFSTGWSGTDWWIGALRTGSALPFTCINIPQLELAVRTPSNFILPLVYSQLTANTTSTGTYYLATRTPAATNIAGIRITEVVKGRWK